MFYEEYFREKESEQSFETWIEIHWADELGEGKGFLDKGKSIYKRIYARKNTVLQKIGSSVSKIYIIKFLKAL